VVVVAAAAAAAEVAAVAAEVAAVAAEVALAAATKSHRISNQITTADISAKTWGWQYIYHGIRNRIIRREFLT